MNRPKLTKKRVFGGCAAAVAVMLGLGAAGLAGAGAGAGPDRVPLPPPPAETKLPQGVGLPEVGVREITKPDGEVHISGLFRNGKVYRVAEPIRRFEVDYGPGRGKGSRTVASGSMVIANPDGSYSPLPPIAPGPAHDRGPTPEQVAEMHRVAGVDPVTGDPLDENLRQGRPPTP
jgi:hypothetical protein